MGVEGKVPAGVAERLVEPDKGWVDSLIAPSVLSVKQSDVLEMASAGSVSELTHA